MVWDAPDGKWSRPPAFDDGAAGLVSTVDDLLRLRPDVPATAASPVLSRESVERDDARPVDARNSGPPAPGFLDDRSWGLGQSVIVSGERAGAFGWDGGLGSSFLVDPHRDLVVIVLTQRLFDSPQPPAVHNDVQDAAYAALR